MLSLELINYSLKNLWHSRSRSILTIFSIFIGITTIFIFVSFGWGLYDYTNSFTTGSSVDKIVIQARSNSAPGLDNAFQLTEDDLEAIENTDGVIEAAGSYFRAAEIKQREKIVYTFFASYDPEIPMMIELGSLKLQEGRWLRPGEKGGALLGYNYLLEDKIFPVPYELGDRIEIDGVDITVVGFLQSVGNPQDDAQIYVTNDYMEDLYENLSYGMIVARVDFDNMQETIEKVEKNLRNQRNLDEGKEDFFVQSFEDLIASFQTALNVIIGFVILIAFISIVVSAVNTANTMVTSVLERIKEIGIMKSVGATNSEIFKIFLFESAFLGFVAGVFGAILGWGLSYLAGVILDSLGWGFLSPHLSIYLFAGCVAFATLTGAISGAWPAWQATRIKPVEALRYE